MVTTVICVLKTGGAYDFGHVARLAFQLRANGVDGDNFVCLTDDETALDADFSDRLKFGWPGWWSKIEVLNQPGPLLYLDLDVNVVGDLGPMLDLATQHEFVMSRGFWGDEDPNPFNSSVMAWKARAPQHLYERFMAEPERYIAEHSKMPAARTKWGDQGFIAAHHHSSIGTWQNLLPGSVLSYKRDLLLGVKLGDARVVASHGQPKPWDPDGADAWLRKHRPAA